MEIGLKRAYDPPSRKDGQRFLVDRLWPRGLKKEDAQIDEWLRDLAPSDELRKWYHARPAQWPAFRKRYLKELAAPESRAALERLYSAAAQGQVTLVFSSKNEDRNNAVVLKELLEGARKPPSGTGPLGAVAGQARVRAVRR